MGRMNVSAVAGWNLLDRLRKRSWASTGRLRSTLMTSRNTSTNGVHRWQRANHSKMKHAIATQTEHIAGFSFARCRCALGMEIFSNGLELSVTSKTANGRRKGSENFAQTSPKRRGHRWAQR